MPAVASQTQLPPPPPLPSTPAVTEATPPSAPPVPPLQPAAPPPPPSPPRGNATWVAVRYVTYVPSGKDETYSRFTFTLRNDGPLPLSTHLAPTKQGSLVAINPSDVLQLPPGGAVNVEVSLPTRLLEQTVEVRISIPAAPVYVPLDPSRFPKPAAAAPDEGSSSQAALVVLGFIVSAGVAYWCRRRYRQSLEEESGAAAVPGGGSGANPYARVGDATPGEGEDAPAAAPAHGSGNAGGGKGVQLGVIGAAVAALPERLRQPRRQRRGAPGPAAVGLVLGAGTVVGSHEEAVASRGGRSAASHPGGAGGAPGDRPASPQEWQGAWQEDDGGWDLDDDALLSDTEQPEQPEGAKPRRESAAAAKSDAAGAEKRSKSQGSDSDWDV